MFMIILRINIDKVFLFQNMTFIKIKNVKVKRRVFAPIRVK